MSARAKEQNASTFVHFLSNGGLFEPDVQDNGLRLYCYAVLSFFKSFIFCLHSLHSP